MPLTFSLQSKKTRRVAQSTKEVEALALQKVAVHCVVLRSFIEELTSITLSIKINFVLSVFFTYTLTDRRNCDNKSLVQNSTNTRDLTWMFVRDIYEQGEIDEARWTPSDE